MHTIPNFIEYNKKLSSYLQNQREAILTLSECAKHQKAIVDNVLDLSKIEVHKVELNTVAFDPKHTINTVIQMFKPQLQEKGLTINFVPQEEDIIVKGDPGRLSQVIINLISNAVKYTYKGGIIIGLKVLGDNNNRTTIYVEVMDTGLGMTIEEQSKIFQRFSQANQFLRSKYGGFGLGLVISKSLVELMGGKIWVDSEIGKGSKFAFTFICDNLLPSEIQQLEQAKKTVAPALVKTQKLHILVVEDNLVNQKIILRYMHQMGYTCQTAEDGIIATEKFQTYNFDVILMDIEMPRMSGLEATHLIRERERQLGLVPTPIIGLSGNARKEHADEAIKVGMNDYVTKPYHKDDLCSRIEATTKRKYSNIDS